MATGDQGDMLRRLKAVLPNGWFNAPTPTLDAVLSGFASALAWAYSLIAFAGEQVLIGTSSGPFLDLHAQDFFGLGGFPRRTNETNAAYAARLLPAIFPQGNTREAMTQALLGLTGQSPQIFEPARPADTGAWNNASTMCYGGAAAVTEIIDTMIVAQSGASLMLNGQVCETMRPIPGAQGNPVAAVGAYGSLQLPFQSFIVARRRFTETTGNVGGYLNGSAPYAPGGYGVGALEYASTSMIGGAIPDAAIYSVIEGAEPAGSIMWSNIQNVA